MSRMVTQFPNVSPVAIVAAIVIVCVIVTLGNVEVRRGQENRIGDVVGVIFLLLLVGVPLYFFFADPLGWMR